VVRKRAAKISVNSVIYAGVRRTSYFCRMTIVPPYLKKGDTIAIVCPAGFLPAENAETCISVLRDWGFKVKTGKTLGSQFNYFSGTDAERLQDFQQALDDDHVQAILCGRGGYGISRIIDQVDFSKFSRNPKWIIGFSDVTIFHAHILRQYNIATLHSSMAAAFADDRYKNEFIQSIRTALTGEKTNITCATHEFNKQGNAEAQLVGGNLSLIAHLIGTNSDVDTTGKILFIEDVGEYLYNVDRMLIQLQRAGKLDALAGLIIGGFSDMKDTTNSFGQTAYEIINDKVSQYDYPVCYSFPVSHEVDNYALKIGVNYQLEVNDDGARLTEVY
jgi:muramoyltetrapeptide carboxypeptidase